MGQVPKKNGWRGRGFIRYVYPAFARLGPHPITIFKERAHDVITARPIALKTDKGRQKHDSGSEDGEDSSFTSYSP